MVIDFGDLKVFLQNVHDRFDHGFIVYKDDLWARQVPSDGLKWIIVDYIPTAENLARDIFRGAVKYFMAALLRPICVKVWETPTSMAAYRDTDFYDEFIDV